MASESFLYVINKLKTSERFSKCHKSSENEIRSLSVQEFSLLTMSKLSELVNVLLRESAWAVDFSKINDLLIHTNYKLIFNQI